MMPTVVSKLANPLKKRLEKNGPTAEPLESRIAPAVFTVTTAADTVDAGDGVLSLREAIIAANATTNISFPDEIQFNIPGPGPHAITLDVTFGLLPDIIDPVLIDGYSEPGSQPNTNGIGQTGPINTNLMIQLNGSELLGFANANGLTIRTDTSTVRGLSITGFSSAAILIDGMTANGNVIEGNFLGLSPSGEIGGNGIGVQINNGGGNTIGNDGLLGNLISSNGTGIAIYEAMQPNDIFGNLIGTASNATSPFGNLGDGIVIAANNVRVGGIDPNQGNIIAHNNGAGVRILPTLAGSSANNTVRGNQISFNAGLGIDLGFDGTTPNDPNDPDTGANALQNTPQLTSAIVNAGTTLVDGSLESTPSTTFIVDLYATATATPSSAQGQKFIASQTVTTNSSGFAAINFNIPQSLNGFAFTTTATAMGTGDTSEFSNGMFTAGIGITVDTADDAVDGGGGMTSLREAILAANAMPGFNPIIFAIPGTGVQTIILNAGNGPLPAITEAVILDAYSQNTAQPNNLNIGNNAAIKIALAGFNISTGEGITLAGMGGSIVRGFSIQDFSEGGILVLSSHNRIEGNYLGLDTGGNDAAPNGDSAVDISSGAANVIGGQAPADRNIIGGNSSAAGIYVRNNTADTLIYNNYIGTNASGTSARANASGITIEGGSTVKIGQPNTASSFRGNVISGNNDSGIIILGFGKTGGDIVGNIIGMNAFGSNSVPNAGSGILLSEVVGAFIGGNQPGYGNLISGNTADGIYIENSAAVQIFGNYIGTGLDGTDTFSNTVGINVLSSTDVSIGGGGTAPTIGTNLFIASSQGNLITGNSSHGVRVENVDFPSSASVRNNSIFNNGGLGINLFRLGDPTNGVTPNDSDDSDGGPNNLLNFPTLTTSGGGATTTINAQYQGETNFSGTIHFYANMAADPSGYGEGQIYLGSNSINANAAGFGTTSFTTGFSFPGGTYYTATTSDSDGTATSEFSLAAFVSAAGTTYTWTGLDSVDPTNWFSPSNWSPNGVPTGADTAVLDSNLTINIPGGMVASVGILDQSTGTITGTGDLNVLTTYNWTAGTLSGTGHTIFPSTSTVTISGSSSKKLFGRFFDLEGFASLSDDLFFDSGVLNIQAGATLIANAGADILDTDGAATTALMNITGLVQFSTSAGGGTIAGLSAINTSIDGNFQLTEGTLNIASPFNHQGIALINTGTLNFSQGGALSGGFDTGSFSNTLQFSDGNFQVNSGTFFDGSGLIQANGGNLNILADISVQNLDFSSGQIGGPNKLTINNTLNWSGGDFTGFGTTQINNTALLNLLGSAGKTLHQRTLEITSTATANLGGTASLNISGNATISNSGLINLLDDLDILAGPLGGGGSLLNFSTLITGSNPTDINSVEIFYTQSGSGSLTVADGTLRLAGTSDLKGGNYSSGPTGQIIFEGPSHNINGAVSISAPVTIQGLANLQINGTNSLTFTGGGTFASGTIGGSGDLILDSDFTWSGGLMNGTGNTNVIFSKTVTLTGSDPRGIAQRTFNNSGNLLFNAATGFNLEQGATLNNFGALDLNDQPFNAFTGVGTINNIGDLIKDGPTGTTVIPTAIAVNNSGSFYIGSGTVELRGGLTQTAGETYLVGGTIGDGPGNLTFQFNGGQLHGVGTINANVQLTTATLRAGNSPGIMVINGDLTLGAASTISAEIGGTTPGADYDQIQISGNATLAGTLTLVRFNGYSPLIGNDHDILTIGGTTTGSFASVNDALGLLNISYPAGAVRVTRIPGDFTWNGSGDTDWFNPENWDLNQVPQPGDSATLDASAFSTTIQLTAPAEITNFTQSAGTFDGNNFNFAVSGLFQWDQGTHTGAGTTTVLPGGTFTFNSISPTDTKTLSNRALQILGTGTVTASDDLTINDGGFLIIGGAFNSASLFDIRHGTGATGTVQILPGGSWTQATGSSDIGADIYFNAQGNISVPTSLSSLNIQGGGEFSGNTISLAAATSHLRLQSDFTFLTNTDLVGNGVIHTETGTTTILSSITLGSSTGGVYSLEGGLLTGGGSIGMNGRIIWSDGIIRNMTVSALAGSAANSINGTATKQLDNATLTFSGGTTITGAGNIDLQNGSVFIADANISINGGNDFIATSGSGTVRVLAGGNLSNNISNDDNVFNPGVGLENLGTVTASTGNFVFQGGTSGGPATFRTQLTRTITFDGATHNYSGAINFNRASGGGDFIFQSGTMTLFTSGQISGGGNFRIEGGTVNASDLSIANNNAITVNGGTLNYAANAGTLTINGALNVNGGGVNLLNNNFAISSTGALNLASGTFNLSNTLTNSGTITFNGTSGIRFNSATLNNSGTINIPASNTTFTAFEDNGGTNTISNLAAGTINHTSTGTSTVGFGIAFNNAGTINALAGTLALPNSFTQTAGTTALSGGSISGAGTLAFTGGQLTGNGTVFASVNNSGAVIRPGGTGTAGTLTINNVFTQSASGTLAFEATGSTAGQFDQLIVNGTTTLGGTLNVDFLGAYTPSAGTNFRVVSTGSSPGVFANLTGENAGFNQIGDAAGLRLTNGAVNFTWDAGAGGDQSWFNPLNWSPDGVPGTTDTAVLNTPNTINLSGTDATVTAFFQADGEITGDANFTISDTFLWAGGSQTGTGTTILPVTSATSLLGTITTSRPINNAGVITASTTATWNLQGGDTVTNTGTINITASDFIIEARNGGSGNFINATGGTLTISSTGNTMFGGGFNNNGTVSLLSNATFTHSSPGTSTGIFNLLAGSQFTIKHSFATSTLSNATINGSGTFKLESISSLLIPTGTATTFASGVTYIQENGRLDGPGTINFNGPTTLFQAGQYSGLITNLGATSTTTLTNGGLSDGATLNNAGTATFSGGFGFAGNATLNNTGSITIPLNAITDFTGSVNAGTIINAAGATFTKLPSGNFTAFQVPFQNFGTFRNEGSVAFTPYTQTGASAVFQFVGGLAGGNMTINGGTVTGTGTHSSNTFTNNGGTIRPGGTGAAGTLALNNFTQTSGGTVAIELGGTTPGTQFDQLALTGTNTLGGTLDLAHISGFTPTAGQNFRVVSSPTNPGTFTTLTGATAGKTQTADSTGLVIAQAGITYIWDNSFGNGDWFNPLNWHLDSGVPGAADTAVLDIASTINLTADTSVGTFQISAGTFDGSAALTVLSNLNWTGGKLTDNPASVLNIASSAAFNISGSATKTIGGGTMGGGTVNNAGTATFVGTGAIDLNSGSFINQTGGIFDIQNDAQIRDFDGTSSAASFINAGILRKTAGTGTTLFLLPVTNTATLQVSTGTISVTQGPSNSGSVDVSSGAALLLDGTATHTGTFNTAVGGVIQFIGGNHTLGLGTAFTGDGLQISGATLSVAAGATVPASRVILSSGTLGGAGTVNINNSLTWTGGNLTDTSSGVANIAAGATLTISGAAVKTMNGGTINNAGTATFTGTGTLNLDIGNFVNKAGGIFDIQNDTQIRDFDGSSSAASFANAGILRKSAGTGTSSFLLPVTNSAGVDIQTGTLSFQTSYTQTAGYTALNGGALAGGINFAFQGGELRGTGTITGNVNNTGAVVRPGDVATATFPATISLGTLTGANGFKLPGVNNGDNVGGPVSDAGDVNGDGYADIIVTAFFADEGGTDRGATYVVFGSPGDFPASLPLSSLNGTNGFKLTGINNNDFAGSWATGAGDVNGDGFDDIIIGAYGADEGGADRGAAYVVFGKATGFTPAMSLATLNGANGFKIPGLADSDFAGDCVGAAGDVNGDGFDDIIIGASGADEGGVDRGAAYVIFGQASGFLPTFSLASLTGANGFKLSGVNDGDFAGSSVSDAGDLNGDGFDDVIVSSYFADEGGTDRGAAYVIFGRASGFAATLPLANLNGTNGFKLSGAANGDRAGYAINAAGDLNGDGFDDVVLGAYLADEGGLDRGAAYVVFGKASGFTTTLSLAALDGLNGFKIAGLNDDDTLGGAVSGAGDINGDGLADLILGANRADEGGNNRGASYVIFGRASGFGTAFSLSSLNGSNGFKLSGVADLAGGLYVSTAGDMNGDLVADIVVSSTAIDGPGAAYVVFGAGAIRSAGTLTISGNYTQSSNGTLFADLEGTSAGQFDLLSVGGNASLNGTISINNIGGFTPTTGDTFRVISSATNTGITQFSALTGDTFGITQQPDATGLVIAKSTLTYTWDGSDSSDWFDPDNWDLNAVPGAGDTARLDNGTLPNQPNLTAAATVGVWQQTAGTLSGNTLTVTDGLDWSGGTIAGNLSTGATSSNTITGTGSNIFSGALLALDGTTTVTGTGSITNSPASEIRNLGTFNFSGDADILGGGNFHNFAGSAGIFKTDNSSTTLAINFLNGDDIAVNAGSLSLSGGSSWIGFTTTTVASGAFLAFSGGTHSIVTSTIGGAGTTQFTGGTISLASPMTINTAFQQTGGTLDGNSDLTTNAQFTWSGGAQSGTARTVVNGNLLLTGTADKTISARTFAVAGTTTLTNTGNLALASGAVFEHTGLFNITSDADITGSGTLRALAGGSGLRKSGGTGVTDIAVSVQDAVGLKALSGTLALNGGGNASSGLSHEASTGAILNATGVAFGNTTTFTGAGTYNLTGGSISGGSITSGTTANLSGISLGGNVTALPGSIITFSSLIGVPTNTLHIQTTQATITAGQMNNITVDAGGIVTVLNGAAKGLTSDITNNGTIRFSHTDAFNVTNGSHFINAGTIEFTTDTTFNRTGGNPPIFENLATGTLRKTGGTGTTAINGAASQTSNLGLIEVLTGTLSIGGGINNSGTVFVDAGTTLSGGPIASTGAINFGGSITGNITLNAGGSLNGSGTITGNVANTAGTVRPGDAGDIGTINISGTYNQGAAARLEVELGGTGAGQFDVLDVSTAATLGGTLDVAYNGYLPVFNDTFRIVRSLNNPGNFASFTGETDLLNSTPNATGLNLNRANVSFTFDGSTSTDWFDADNWTPRGIPGPGDTANLTTPGLTTTLGANADVTFLFQSAGTLTGPGTLTIGGDFTWTGGTQSGSGTTLVPAGVSFTASGSGELLLDQRTLQLDGTSSKTGTGNFNLLNSADLLIGGIFNLDGDSDFTGSTSTISITPSGSFTKASGTGQTLFGTDLVLDVRGPIQVSTGFITIAGNSTALGTTLTALSGAEMEFSTGVFHWLGAANFQGSGDFRITSGRVALDVGGTLANPGTNLTVDGGILDVDGAFIVPASTSLDLSTGRVEVQGGLVINGDMNWRGGTLTGLGQTTISATGRLLTSTASDHIMLGHTIENLGLIRWTGDGTWTLDQDILAGNPIIRNSGTFIINGGGDFRSYTGGAIVRNNVGGTIEKASGTLSEFGSGVRLDNFDTVRVAAEGGAIFLRLSGGGQTTGGSFQVADDGVLQIGGTTPYIATGNLAISGNSRIEILTGATFRIDTLSTVTITDATLRLDGGTIAGSGNLITDGDLDLRSGNLIETGSITALSTSITTLAAGALLTISQRTLNLDGDVNLNGNINFNSGEITLAGNTNVNASITIRDNDGAATATSLVNDGFLSLNDDLTLIGVTLANDDTVDLGGGYELDASAGGYTQSNADVSPVTDLNGGTLRADFNLATGTLTGHGTVDGDLTNDALIEIPSGDTGGSINVTGTYTQTGAGQLDLHVANNAGGIAQVAQLVVTGNASVSGTLNFIEDTAPAGYIPATNYDALTAAAVSGIFGTINGVPQNANFAYSATSAGFVTQSLAIPTEVNTTLDTVDAFDAFTSLREAIIYANTTAGTQTITFNIPASGVQILQPLSPLPSITEAIIIDGYSQPGATANTLAIGDDANLLIVINGALITSPSDGITLQNTGSTITGLVINGFTQGAAIRAIGGGSHIISGNFIGMDAAGAVAVTNQNGILLENSTGSTVGGPAPADRNLVAGQVGVGTYTTGIGIQLFTTTNTTVTNNYVGFARNGTAAIQNGTGIGLYNGASGNTVSNNLLGNLTGHGIDLAFDSDSNTLRGNLVGTDITGTVAAPIVGAAVLINFSSDLNTIGGATLANRNILASSSVGVVINEGVSNRVEGNYIGTNAAGTATLGNVNYGVQIGASGANTIIGNLVAGSPTGIRIEGGTNGGLITGNNIGLNAARTAALPNTNGIILDASSNITVSANTIAGNTASGITLSGGGSHLIESNFIGYQPVVAGTYAEFHAGNSIGIRIIGGSTNNDIGGTSVGNIIVSNTDDGIQLSSAGTGNLVRGNRIGQTGFTTGAHGNGGAGVHVINTPGVTIGGTSLSVLNIISHNTGDGVIVEGSTSRALVRGNIMENNGARGINIVGNIGDDTNDAGDTDSGPNTLLNFPVFTGSIGGTSGVSVQGTYNSTPNTTFNLDFYTTSGPREGRTLLASSTVTTNASGNATFSVPLGIITAGDQITATASSSDSTSEFALPIVPDDGRPRISITRAGGGENIGGSTITFRLSLDKASTDPVTVTLNSTDAFAGALTATPGSDYTAVVNQVVTFAPNQTEADFTVTVLDDGQLENREFFNIELSAPTNGTLDSSASVALGAINDNERRVLAVGSDRTPNVGLYSNALIGAAIAPIPVHPLGAALGTRTAMGDVNGDGTPDIVVGHGRGGLVQVFDGTTGAKIKEFNPFGRSYRGSVFVAAGDVNGDGFAEIISGTGAGNKSRIVVSDASGDGLIPTALAAFNAFSSSSGGVRVAAGDVNGDGLADIIAGTGKGSAVKVFDGQTGSQLSGPGTSFTNVFSRSYRGGVFVAAGDTDGDGIDNIIVGAASKSASFKILGSDGVFDTYTAYSGKGRGVRIAALDLNGDAIADIVTAQGRKGNRAVEIHDVSGLSPVRIGGFIAIEPIGRNDGLYVG